MKGAVSVVFFAWLVCFVAAQSGETAVAGDQELEPETMLMWCNCRVNEEEDSCFMEMIPKKYKNASGKKYQGVDCTKVQVTAVKMPKPELTNNTVASVQSSLKSNETTEAASSLPAETERISTEKPATAKPSEGTGVTSEKPSEGTRVTSEKPSEGTAVASNSSTLPPIVGNASTSNPKSSSEASVPTTDMSGRTSPNSTEGGPTTPESKASDAADGGSDYLYYTIPLICIVLIAMGFAGYFTYRYTKKAGYLQQTGKSSINGDSSKRASEGV